nr:MAG TPA: hypothetical protein [Caudoviricetes sp.]
MTAIGGDILIISFTLDPPSSTVDPISRNLMKLHLRAS